MKHPFLLFFAGMPCPWGSFSLPHAEDLGLFPVHGEGLDGLALFGLGLVLADTALGDEITERVGHVATLQGILTGHGLDRRPKGGIGLLGLVVLQLSEIAENKTVDGEIGIHILGEKLHPAGGVF